MSANGSVGPAGYLPYPARYRVPPSIVIKGIAAGCDIDDVPSANSIAPSVGQHEAM
jgi:hypothetical protein